MRLSRCRARVRTLFIRSICVVLLLSAATARVTGSDDHQAVHAQSEATGSATARSSQDRRTAATTSAETSALAQPRRPPARDAHGRIKRDRSARRAFMRRTGYPHGRPGYVVDHVLPLACGGADDPSNMQWQTRADAKAKDRIERRGC